MPTQSTPASSEAASADAAQTKPVPLLPVQNPPPQSEGSPRRLYTTGGPALQERISVALQVLRDPVARNSFTRPYSGQPRNWTR